MEIRRTLLNDIEAILKIYEQARVFMREHGNPNQWNKGYPDGATIERDIAQDNSYVCVDGGEIVGTFMFVKGEDPTYLNIYQGNWINDTPYGVVHRIASAVGKRGVATFCLNWCFQQCGNIRIDTHGDNYPMKNLLNKIGYTECGIIYLMDGDERIAFQKADYIM